MLRHIQAGVSLAVLLAAGAGWKLPPVQAQDQPFTREILARGRVFTEIGPGVIALKRDAAGRYFVLAAPAKVIAVYAADGKRLGQIPNADSPGAKIVYAEDMDLDSAGRVVVADRGADAVKIFNADGSLDATFPVAAPISVVALSGSEFAVAQLRSRRLVSIFDVHGRLVRSFGDMVGAAESASRDQPLSHGRLYGDSASHIYFVFTELSDPTVRKYDRFGYASYEITLPSSEFTPEAEARRWNSITIEKSGAPASATKPVIRALGVDPETQEVWAAIGDELIHFDKDGNRRAAYRTSTKEGAPLEASAILVERNRILLAADPLGVFDFAIPDKQPAASPPR
ncbi:MAG TPA: hypothetical protein VJO53_09635 [Candidatus Acidoferrales bacterium]|nr:hypothetical protein [Candidatus Acidoferrales bacterium]